MRSGMVRVSLAKWPRQRQTWRMPELRERRRTLDGGARSEAEAELLGVSQAPLSLTSKRPGLAVKQGLDGQPAQALARPRRAPARGELFVRERCARTRRETRVSSSAAASVGGLLVGEVAERARRRGA